MSIFDKKADSAKIERLKEFLRYFSPEVEDYVVEMIFAVCKEMDDPLWFYIESGWMFKRLYESKNQ